MVNHFISQLNPLKYPIIHWIVKKYTHCTLNTFNRYLKSNLMLAYYKAYGKSWSVYVCMYMFMYIYHLQQRTLIFLPAIDDPCTGYVGSGGDLCHDVLPAKGDPGTAGRCGGLCPDVCQHRSGWSGSLAVQKNSLDKNNAQLTGTVQYTITDMIKKIMCIF